MLIDVFNDEAFSSVSLTRALDRQPYVPQLLGSMGIFETEPVATTSIAVEKRQGQLKLVDITQRGAPLPQATKDPRDIRNFNTVRVAKGDRLNASEIQNIRAFGTETELERAVAEVVRRQAKLRRDVELTHEHMRLAAVQGLLVDAAGQTVFNFWNLWNESQPAEIDFDLDNASPATGALRKKCAQVVRAIVKGSHGAVTPQSSIVGLCGDAFWDDLINHPHVQKTYENWEAAASLRDAPIYSEFRFGGIDWVNYRGTDDGSTVAINTDKVKFFPRNAPGAFLRVNGPGESQEWANQPGQDVYGLIVPDRDRGFWTDIEVYSYPLYLPTLMQTLQSGRRT